MTKNQNKTKETDDSVDHFISSVEPLDKREDAITIISMLSEVTGVEPKMWGKSIVGFGNYHYKYDSGREGDSMKIGFSPRKLNLTVYIMPGFKKYNELMKNLGKYKTGKSCLYIKRLEDIDRSVLKSLMTDSYDHMTKKYG